MNNNTMVFKFEIVTHVIFQSILFLHQYFICFIYCRGSIIILLSVMYL